MRTFGAYAIKEIKLDYPYELPCEYQTNKNITIRNQLTMREIQYVDCSDVKLGNHLYMIEVKTEGKEANCCDHNWSLCHKRD